MQTIERTSKALKSQVLASVLLVISGMFMTCISSAARQEESNGPGYAGIGQFGALMASGGLVWFLVTRIRIWWHHD